MVRPYNSLIYNALLGSLQPTQYGRFSKRPPIKRIPRQRSIRLELNNWAAMHYSLNHRIDTLKFIS